MWMHLCYVCCDQSFTIRRPRYSYRLHINQYGIRLAFLGVAVLLVRLFTFQSAISGRGAENVTKLDSSLMLATIHSPPSHPATLHQIGSAEFVHVTGLPVPTL